MSEVSEQMVAELDWCSVLTPEAVLPQATRGGKPGGGTRCSRHSMAFYWLIWEGRCEQLCSPVDGVSRVHEQKKAIGCLEKEGGNLQLMGLPLEEVLSPEVSMDHQGKARCGFDTHPGQSLCSSLRDLVLTSQEIQLPLLILFILMNHF